MDTLEFTPCYCDSYSYNYSYGYLGLDGHPSALADAYAYGPAARCEPSAGLADAGHRPAPLPLLNAAPDARLVDDDDANFQLALRRSLDEGPAPCPGDDDADLLLALQLSLDQSDDGDLRLAQQLQAAEDSGLALRLRKGQEEALTAEALGDVQQLVVPAFEAADGTITIGAARYRRVECGASHDGDWNLCGYLSLTGGDGAAAATLKKRLAPAATAFAQKLGVPGVDFGASGTRADTEVIRAYVRLERTPVCVYNATAQVATSYTCETCDRDCIHLYLASGHYQRLVRA